jgi:hypothetical protein
MDESTRAARNPFSSSLRKLAAFWSLRKPPAPKRVEVLATFFGSWCAEDVDCLCRHCDLCPPGESLSSWIDRWDYEARILEVDGVFVAAPHTTP